MKVLRRGTLVVALLAASCATSSLSEASASARAASPWTFVEATDADGAALCALEALRLQLVVQGGCSTAGGAAARRQFLAAIPETAVTPADAVVVAHGAAFIDLSNIVPADGYYDIVHANEIGRAIFTTALLEILT